jgi:hypothetical protein
MLMLDLSQVRLSLNKLQRDLNGIPHPIFEKTAYLDNIKECGHASDELRMKMDEWCEVLQDEIDRE